MVDPIGGPLPLPATGAPAQENPDARVPGQGLPTDRVEELRQAAQELEATFIAEMLKQARFGEARGAFGGGAGEEQFASFLRTEHAQAIAAQGGFGLAESIFNALVARVEGES